MSIKAIIFDYGKVLTLPQCEQHLAEMTDLLRVEKQKLLTGYYHFRPLYDTGTIDGPEYWQKVADYLGCKLPNEIVPRLIACDLDSWSRQNVDMWELIPKLRKRYKTALLSNNINELVVRIEKELALAQYFDVAVFSNRFCCLKPDHRIYKHCLDQLQVNNEQAVFIDDRDINVDAAKDLGIHGIVFYNYRQLCQQLEKILGTDL